MSVSIIIPVFNAEKYVEECIVSALHQSYRDIEIIVVDDGSTDTSPSILNKYKDQLQIITKTQGGVASARNAGIKIAKGEWIKLLDNDDLLYPNAIADLLEEAAKIEKENKILYANVDYINEKSHFIGQLIEPDYNALNSFDINTILLDHNIGIPSTWFIHRSVIARCGLFDELTEHDDYEYHLRACLLYNCRFHLLPKKIAQYRFHANQFTWQVMRKYQSQDNVAAHILSMLDSNQRRTYEIALYQLRNNRSLFEKLAYRVRPLLKYLPIHMEIRLRTMYLQFVEMQKEKARKKGG